MRTLENEFDASHSFGAEHGFVVAAAITAFDGKAFNITDPTIGELKFYYKTWDLEADTGLLFNEIETRPCVPSDFPQYKDETF